MYLHKSVIALALFLGCLNEASLHKNHLRFYQQPTAINSDNLLRGPIFKLIEGF